KEALRLCGTVQDGLKSSERRGRDSNPWRGCKPPHRFSKPALSATQPPLRRFPSAFFISACVDSSVSALPGFPFPTLPSRQVAPGGRNPPEATPPDPCTGGSATSSDSSRKPRRRKAADRPKKPYPEFPLPPQAPRTDVAEVRRDD